MPNSKNLPNNLRQKQYFGRENAIKTAKKILKKTTNKKKTNSKKIEAATTSWNNSSTANYEDETDMSATSSAGTKVVSKIWKRSFESAVESKQKFKSSKNRSAKWAKFSNTSEIREETSSLSPGMSYSDALCGRSRFGAITVEHLLTQTIEGGSPKKPKNTWLGFSFNQRDGVENGNEKAMGTPLPETKGTLQSSVINPAEKSSDGNAFNLKTFLINLPATPHPSHCPTESLKESPKIDVYTYSYFSSPDQLEAFKNAGGVRPTESVVEYSIWCNILLCCSYMERFYRKATLDSCPHNANNKSSTYTASECDSIGNNKDQLMIFGTPETIFRDPSSSSSFGHNSTRESFSSADSTLNSHALPQSHQRPHPKETIKASPTYKSTSLFDDIVVDNSNKRNVFNVLSSFSNLKATTSSRPQQRSNPAKTLNEPPTYEFSRFFYAIIRDYQAKENVSNIESNSANINATLHQSSHPPKSLEEDGFAQRNHPLASI